MDKEPTFLSNGERYLGDFRKGAYNGQGLFAFSDGSRYLGQWKNGLFHGSGILFGRNGENQVEEGEWIDGLLHGKDQALRTIM